MLGTGSRMSRSELVSKHTFEPEEDDLAFNNSDFRTQSVDRKTSGIP